MTEQEKQTFDKKQLNITYGKVAAYLIGVAGLIFSLWQFTLNTQATILKAKTDIERAIQTEVSRNDAQDTDIERIENWVRTKASKDDVEGVEKDVDNLRYRVNRYHN